ncbi:MAG: stalk domain-containing protein, partial [Firmicutes bacterium]|nr:stalk domain-containing protein [Bacillota bacterium]
GLAAGTTYTYRVRAVGNGSYIHDSGYSNEASAQTYSGSIELPVWLAAPSGLTATTISNTQIQLAWIDQSANEFGYSIERKTDSESFDPIDSVLANVTSYIDSGLTAGTTYTYRVKAYGNGSYVHNSEYSNEASTTTKAVPVAQKVLRFYIGKSDYFVNNQIQSMDTVPITPNSRTLLPITYVATPLGAVVNWNDAEQKVTITLNTTTIEMWIGRNTAKVNGVAALIDPVNPGVVPIVVPPGRTMLPLRFIAEQFNSQVDWDPVQEMVTVSYPKL